MSKDLNMVQLTGNLGKDPETKYTPQGSGVTKFSVAASRRWRTAEGEDRADTEWFNVVAWNKLGEICAQYLQKGSRVYIEGRLQTHWRMMRALRASIRPRRSGSARLAPTRRATHRCSSPPCSPRTPMMVAAS